MPVFGYTLALTLSGVSGAARLAMLTGGAIPFPFLLFYPAIAAVSFFAGWGPGMLSIMASAFFAVLLFPALPALPNWIALSILGPLFVTGFAYLRDIREQNTATQREYARFRFITEHIRDWIFLTTEEGVIQYANGTACNTFGDPLTLRPITDLTSECRREALKTLLRECCAGKASTCEILFTRPDGTQVHAEVSGTAVRTADSVVIHLAARDLTERRQLDQKLREARQWESLRVLAGGLAHDFNNLLTSILGNATLARQDLPDRHPVVPLLSNIEEAGERSAQLVRMMLATSGYRPRYSERVSMDELLHSILAQVDTPLRIRVATEVSPVEFEGDRISLGTLLSSLIANAGESYGEGSGEIRIAIRTAPSADPGEGSFDEGDPGSSQCLRIVVEDHGCGMTDEVLERAFDPFFSTKFMGRGLGLPAVRGIARAYAGRLWLRTAAGAGTRVEIWLPLHPPNPL